MNVDRIEEWLAQGRLMDGTKANYRTSLRSWLAWLGPKKYKPGAEAAREYLNQLEEAGRKAATIATIGYALKGYLKHLGLPNDLQFPKIQMGPPKYLTEENILGKLIPSCPTRFARVVVAVLYDSGARAREILNLERKNIRWGLVDDQEAPYALLTVQRKGGRIDQVRISEFGIGYLKPWVQETRGRLVFEGWTYWDAYRQIREAYRKAGLPSGGLHVLRHSRSISLLYGAKLPPEMVRDQLGHTSLATTMNIYGRLRPEHIRLPVPGRVSA